MGGEILELASERLMRLGREEAALLNAEAEMNLLKKELAVRFKFIRS